MTGIEFTALRKQLGYSITELARYLGVDPTTIWRNERLDTVPIMYVLGIGTMPAKKRKKVKP